MWLEIYAWMGTIASTECVWLGTVEFAIPVTSARAGTVALMEGVEHSNLQERSSFLPEECVWQEMYAWMGTNASTECVWLGTVEFAIPVTSARAGTVALMEGVEHSNLQERSSFLPEECVWQEMYAWVGTIASTECVWLGTVEFAIPVTFARAGTVVLMEAVELLLPPVLA